jgi:regulator of replication initiation timing
MLIDDEPFGCLGVPTPLEMLKHQSAMLCDEIADLSDRLRRSRSNVAELIEMNQQLAAERNILRVKLAEAEARVSACLLQAGQDYNRINGLNRVADQVEMLRRGLAEAEQKLRACEAADAPPPLQAQSHLN